MKNVTSKGDIFETLTFGRYCVYSVWMIFLDPKYLMITGESRRNVTISLNFRFKLTLRLTRTLASQHNCHRPNGGVSWFLLETALPHMTCYLLLWCFNRFHFLRCRGLFNRLFCSKEIIIVVTFK